MSSLCAHCRCHRPCHSAAELLLLQVVYKPCKLALFSVKLVPASCHHRRALLTSFVRCLERTRGTSLCSPSSHSDVSPPTLKLIDKLQTLLPQLPIILVILLVVVLVVALLAGDQERELVPVPQPPDTLPVLREHHADHFSDVLDLDDRGGRRRWAHPGDVVDEDRGREEVDESNEGAVRGRSGGYAGKGHDLAGCQQVGGGGAVGVELD